MEKPALAILTVCGLLCPGCHNNVGPGGPVTAPTSAVTQAPAVNLKGTGTVGGQSIQVPWSGNVFFNEQTGANTFGLQLDQTGAQVSGQLSIFGPDGGGGPIVGVVSGTTFNFNFSVGNGGQGCGNTGSGTADVAANTMTGTFSGKRCNGSTYTNGRFTLNLPPGFRTSPYRVGGTWTAFIPSPVGGGRWTFNISETAVDVNGGNVSGSVAVTGGSLGFGSGSITGTVTSTYPGPTTLARMTVSFAGSCPSTIMVNVGFPGGDPAFDGSVMTGGIRGATCNGELPQGLGLNLARQ